MNAVAKTDASPPAEPEWVTWVIAARAGDRAAFERLFERFWPELTRLSRAVLARSSEAEDVVQDAWITAWKRLGSLEHPAAFPAWMRRIVVRRALRRDRLLALRWIGIERDAEEREPAAANAGSPEDVVALMRQLSRQQRAALVLTEVEGRTDEEAAGALGIRPATLRVHRHRARNRLRELLGVSR